MTHPLKMTTAASLVAISSALAAPLSIEPGPTSAANSVAGSSTAFSGDWCHSLKNFGLFHKDPSARFFQELTFSGRVHWQYGAVDGDDVDGSSFDNDFTEFRRARVGAKAKFLDHFTVVGVANIVDDPASSGGTESFEYKNLDTLHLTYKQKNVAGFDSLALRYGRQKIDMGAEATLSSNKIKTVERSALANTIFRSRYTGIKATAVKDNWTGKLGVLNLDNSDAIGSWSHGTAISLNSSWELANGTLTFDALYNFDADDPIGTPGADELGVGFEWVTSLSYQTEIGNWDILMNAVYGDRGDEEYIGTDRDGAFYGFVVIPSTFIIEDRLEFVTRYQYQGSSEDNGIRTNSRYFRATDNNANLNGGRGDSHHSIYAGLNYYLCGHNSKIMTGIEYENLDTPNGDADATTLWAAYRLYF